MINKRKTVGVRTFLAAFLVLGSAGALLQSQFRSKTNAQQEEKVESLNSIEVQTQKVLDRVSPSAASVLDELKSQQRNVQMGEKRSEAHDAFLSPEGFENFSLSLVAFNRYAKSPNRESIRAALLDEFLGSENGLEIAKTILLKPYETLKSFGKEQASARLMAIKMIERSTEKGEPLKVLTLLLQELGNNLDNSPSWEKGIEYDYRDVL